MSSDPRRMESGSFVVSVLYGILDHLLRQYRSIFYEIEVEMVAIERTPRSRLPKDFLERIYRLKKEVSGLDSHLVHFGQLLGTIISKRVPLAGFDERAESSFDLLQDDAEYLGEIVDSLDRQHTGGHRPLHQPNVLRDEPDTEDTSGDHGDGGPTRDRERDARHEPARSPLPSPALAGGGDDRDRDVVRGLRLLSSSAGCGRDLGPHGLGARGWPIHSFIHSLACSPLGLGGMIICQAVPAQYMPKKSSRSASSAPAPAPQKGLETVLDVYEVWLAKQQPRSREAVGATATPSRAPIAAERRRTSRSGRVRGLACFRSLLRVPRPDLGAKTTYLDFTIPTLRS